MTDANRRDVAPGGAPGGAPAGSLSVSRLAAVGLRLGEPARFRRNDAGRWVEGKLARLEVDGSITLHDPNGAARSLRPERVQVRRPGERGRLTWQYVTDVATTWEQLELFALP